MKTLAAYLRSSRADRDKSYDAVRRFSSRIGDQYPENSLAQGLSTTEMFVRSHTHTQEPVSKFEAFLDEGFGSS